MHTSLLPMLAYTICFVTSCVLFGQLTGPAFGSGDPPQVPWCQSRRYDVGDYFGIPRSARRFHPSQQEDLTDSEYEGQERISNATEQHVVHEKSQL